MDMYACFLPPARKRVHEHIYIYVRIETSRIVTFYILHILHAFMRDVCVFCLCVYVAAASVIRVSDLYHSFNYKRQIRTEPRADSVIELLRGNPLSYTRQQ